MTTVLRRRSIRHDMYTDGACSGNPGPGGWAWAVLDLGIFGQGSAKSTTNQRMELQAVLEGLLFWTVTYPRPVRICTDSAYVMNCFVQKWHRSWKDGRKRNGDPVSNWDLWSDLIPLVLENDVTWLKVKGHSGNHGNEYVDRLAVEAKIQQL